MHIDGLLQTTDRQEVVDSTQIPAKESTKIKKINKGGATFGYLFASLYVNSEQSPAVTLSTAGDAANLRGRGQMSGLQQEAQVEERQEEWFHLDISTAEMLQSDNSKKRFPIRGRRL